MLNINVYTSDDHVAIFNKQNIINSLKKETSIDDKHADQIANRIEKAVLKLEEVEISGRLIRGLIENDMIKHGYNNWYSEYNRVGLPIADLKDIWNTTDDLAHDNANQDSKNPETMNNHTVGRINKSAALQLLPKDLCKLHNSGSIHIHDLDAFTIKPFCSDSDLRFIFRYGLLPDGHGSLLPVAKPANNATVAMLHAAKALGCSQTCFSGGQGFMNFNVFMSPYLKDLTYTEIKQLAQLFVFEISQMMVARGAQPIFSSIQLTPGVPRIWWDKPIVCRGKVGPETYSMFEKETRLLFKAFMEVFEAGDAWEKPFSFPKPEVVLSNDFIGDGWDRSIGGLPSYADLYTAAFRVVAKNGGIYLENKLHEKEGIIKCVQCCAYSFEITPNDKNFNDKLYFKNGEHFSNLGSIQVVSLNLPRIAYKSNRDLDKFILELRHLVDSSVRIFEIKREYINKQALPFARQTPYDAPPLCTFDDRSYVIGVVGLNECVQAMTGNQMHESKESWKFGIRIMTELETYVKDKQKDSTLKLAIARTPAETTAQRFAVSDLMDETYKDLATKYVKGNIEKAIKCIDKTRDLPIFYSNGTHLAVDAQVKLPERAKLEGVFFPIVNGGNIFHVFLSDIDPLVDASIAKQGWFHESHAVHIRDAIIDMARRSQLGYIKISKDMTICKECHTVSPGFRNECSKCGSTLIDHQALITGYTSAVSGWNEAKKEELGMRNRYRISEIGG
jgi:ribonucleoside-triphosphate reductase